MAELRGKFFEPSCDAQFDAHVVQGREEVADTVYDRVHRVLSNELENPSGFYEHHVVDLSFADHNLITDSDVVYGPWLEGVSSRNQETRFKGYAAFRRATQSMGNRAGEIVEQHVDLAVTEINS